MSRTRLAAAAGVAALTLGATAAVADDPTATQEVTITVEAIERSVTTDGSATITITSGEATSEAVVTGTPTIAYSNGSDVADIEATISAIGENESPTRDELFDVFGAATGLTIDLAAAADDRTENATTQTIVGQSGENVAIPSSGVLGNIPTNVNRTATAVVYGLSGDAPVTVATTALTVTFTITDD